MDGGAGCVVQRICSLALFLIFLSFCRPVPSAPRLPLVQSGLVSLLCVVSAAADERTIQRRDGSSVALATVLVSDASERFVQLKAWGAAQCASAGLWRTGDVLLCRGMEVTRFRGAVSLTTRAQSKISVMDVRDLGAEGEAAAAASAAAATTAAAAALTGELAEEAAAKRRRVVGGSGGGGGGRREFASARSRLWNEPSDFGSSTSNWAEVCAAARALWSWAQRVDGHALLGRSLEPPQLQSPQLQPPFASPSATSHSSLLNTGAAAAGSDAALQATSAVPYVSLLSLEPGQVVNVSARLRRFCLLPSSVTVRPPPFGTHASGGADPHPAARSQSLCCVLSQDDEGAELLVEAELRAPRWLAEGRLAFFRAALGLRVRLQAVRVLWSARADALALVDTEHTGQHSTIAVISMLLSQCTALSLLFALKPNRFFHL